MTLFTLIILFRKHNGVRLAEQYIFSQVATDWSQFFSVDFEMAVKPSNKHCTVL